MIPGRTPIVLKRECLAAIIPDGGGVTLAQGSWVVVTQALRGSFTVKTDVGCLARIAFRDADALGLSVSDWESDR